MHEQTETMDAWRREGHKELLACAESLGFCVRYVEQDDYMDYWELIGEDGDVYVTSEKADDAQRFVYHLQSFLQGVAYQRGIACPTK